MLVRCSGIRLCNPGACWKWMLKVHAESHTAVRAPFGHQETLAELAKQLARWCCRFAARRRCVHITTAYSGALHTVDPHSRSTQSIVYTGEHRTEWNSHRKEPTQAHRCSGSAASNIRRPHTIEGRRKFFEPEQFRKRRSFAVSSSKCMWMNQNRLWQQLSCEQLSCEQRCFALARSKTAAVCNQRIERISTRNRLSQSDWAAFVAQCSSIRSVARKVENRVRIVFELCSNDFRCLRWIS